VRYRNKQTQQKFVDVRKAQIDRDIARGRDPSRQRPDRGGKDRPQLADRDRPTTREVKRPDTRDIRSRSRSGGT
jgi:hypothetical protein